MYLADCQKAAERLGAIGERPDSGHPGVIFLD